MLNIGCHLSISKGFYAAGKQMIELGGNTFQFFTRNPRGGKAKEIDKNDVLKLHTLMDEYNFAPLFAHASYTMNLCSNKEETRDFANSILLDDMERLKKIERAVYIFHPGSHVGQGKEKGIEMIIQSLNKAIPISGETPILLEMMSGKGTEIGGNLTDIKAIIEGVRDNKNLGVCLDTCHLYSAGYDIVNEIDDVLNNIDKAIGVDRIKAVHLNDSKTPFASKKDRHEKLNEGSIGLEAIKTIIKHPLLKDLTFNLETPNELEGYAQEISLLKSL